MTQPRLHAVPVTLKAANAFVGQEHRHHKPVVGHKFSVGCADESGLLRGVAIAGRPVARGFDPTLTLEVCRLATDGCENACSFLYGLVARIGTAMGYPRHNIITYILASEPGTSLKAAGWVQVADVHGRSWSCESRPRTDKHPTVDKVRWHAARPPEDT